MRGCPRRPRQQRRSSSLAVRIRHRPDRCPVGPDDAELPATGIALPLERQLSAAFIRGRDYGTRASTVIAIDHDGHGFIAERRFGPQGVFLGHSRLDIAP